MVDRTDCRCSTVAAARAWGSCASWSSRKWPCTTRRPCSKPGRRSTTRSADTQQERELQARTHSAGQAYELAQARYDGGMADFLSVLDSQRSYLQARRELAASEGRVGTRYVMVNKAIGNTQLSEGGVTK